MVRIQVFEIGLPAGGRYLQEKCQQSNLVHNSFILNDKGKAFIVGMSNNTLPEVPLGLKLYLLDIVTLWRFELFGSA